MHTAWVLHVCVHENHVRRRITDRQDPLKTDHVSHCKFVIKRNIYTKFTCKNTLKGYNNIKFNSDKPFEVVRFVADRDYWGIKRAEK